MAASDEEIADLANSARLLVQTAEGIEPKSKDPPEILERIQRSRAIGTFASSLIDSMDPQLIPARAVEPLQMALNSLRESLRSYSQSREASLLQEADNRAEQVLTALARLPVLRSPADVEGLREASASFRRSVGQLLGSIRRDAGEVEKALALLTSDMANIRTSAERETESVRSQSSEQIEALKTRVSELSSTTEAQKTRLDEAITQFQQQFSQNQATNAQRFEELTQQQADQVNTLLEQLRVRGDENVEETRSQLNEAIQELRSQADGVITDLKHQEGEARKLVNTIGAIGISGGHGSYAEKQRRDANAWRWIAVGALALVAGFAAVFIFSLPDGPVDLGRTLLRLGVSLPLIGLAGYAARQSARHRENERQARKTELELAAIDPYIELLPEEVKRKIKDEAASRFFGQPMSGNSDSEGLVRPKDLLELLKEALKRS